MATKRKKKITKTQTTFLIVFKKKACNISEACKGAGISRRTYYNWLEDSKPFAELVEEHKESLIDMVESLAVQKMMGGDTTMQIFYLKTKGKERGYVETKEIKQTNTDANPYSGKTLKELQNIKDNHKQQLLEAKERAKKLRKD